jgi:predicted DCC family thiol-disulfide oxidoreductase YuxK
MGACSAVMSSHPVIVFDAECVLCSANARFVLRFDKRGHFRLASMQGEYGAALYRLLGIDPSNPETLIIAAGEQVWRNSDAVLAIWRGLGWPWRALAVFALIPRFVRDPLYLWIARNRYRLFGRRETCWVPDPKHAERML